MNKKQSVVTILALMFLLIVSDILYLYISKRHTANQAVRVYNEFIEGRRCNGGESILSYATPTREPEKRYATDYFMADSTGEMIHQVDMGDVEIVGGTHYVILHWIIQAVACPDYRLAGQI